MQPQTGIGLVVGPPGPGSLRGPMFVPGRFLTLIPAFLIDLMIGQETLGCQSPQPSKEECWGNTGKIGWRVVAGIIVRTSYDIA